MSQLSRVLVVGLLACTTAVVTSGCVLRARARPIGFVYTTGEVYASAPMPPPRIEVVSAARPGYVWVRGYWHWNGGQWVWTGGRYQAQRVGYVWVAPQYVYRGGRHVYVAGSWRGGGGRAHVQTRGAVRVQRQQPRRAPPPPAQQGGGRPPPPPAVGVH